MDVENWLLSQERSLREHVFSKEDMAHAWLWRVDSEYGGYELFKRSARFVFCEHTKTTSCCGQCFSCSFESIDAHPDIMVVKPEEKKNFIGVDAIRSVLDFLQKSSQRGGYRFVVIKQADGLNHQASNALLKTLEEPAGKAVIIIMTQRSHLLPLTILSRCHTWAPSDGGLHDATDASYCGLVSLYKGNVCHADHMISQGYFSIRDGFFSYLKQLKAGDIDVFELSQVLQKQPLDMIFTLSSSLLRDLMVISVVGSEECDLFHYDCLSDVLILSEGVSKQAVDQAWLSYQHVLMVQAQTQVANAALLMDRFVLFWEKLFD